jgi:hypothetical protein
VHGPRCRGTAASERLANQLASVLKIPVELRPSPIHGLGVFTRHALSRGAVVSGFVPPLDVVFPPEFLATLNDAERDYVRRFSYLSRFTGQYILPGDHDRFMNHSDHPNVGMDPSGNYACVALADIESGEELTCDYRTFDAEWALKLSSPCAC